MSLKSNEEPTPMSKRGSTSTATQPERSQLPKDSEADDDTEDNDPDLSEEDLADAAKLTIYSHTENSKVYFQYLVTSDNLTGMPSKAELLAIRFFEGVEKSEQTLLGALVNHFDAMDDMRKRIHALETSARPQELGHLTKKLTVVEIAIQDFRVSVKEALDRRLSKDVLNKVTAKYDKDFDDLLKRSNTDRDTAKELADNLDDALAKHAKDVNDLAEKQAQDLKNLENRFQASLRDRQAVALPRGTPPAGRGTITGQARKRPLTDASDADNRLGSAVPMFDAHDLFLDADFLDNAYCGDENQAKKRRVDAAVGKLDFSDIL
ncbi:hypothetical protein B0T18DRAFT_392432 [Schizothecium vesticola]|uniref:Uncharacterized protein n=1 Tax=Schizothecium vesticola TaxID=314040 RepID=A0AA40K2P0_9PEZI|nr:hypothetical protein B0T18DRAFT_392432 [Schizothecium vesticola]